jgi:hypothetical protein
MQADDMGLIQHMSSSSVSRSPWLVEWSLNPVLASSCIYHLLCMHSELDDCVREKLAISSVKYDLALSKVTVTVLTFESAPVLITDVEPWHYLWH